MQDPASPHTVKSEHIVTARTSETRLRAAELIKEETCMCISSRYVGLTESFFWHTYSLVEGHARTDRNVQASATQIFGRRYRCNRSWRRRCGRCPRHSSSLPDPCRTYCSRHWSPMGRAVWGTCCTGLHRQAAAGLSQPKTRIKECCVQ